MLLHLLWAFTMLLSIDILDLCIEFTRSHLLRDFKCSLVPPILLLRVVSVSYLVS